MTTDQRPDRLPSSPPAESGPRAVGPVSAGAGPEGGTAAKRAQARGLSIFVKLAIVILSLVAGSVCILTFYLSSRQIEELRTDLNGKAATYGHLVAKQVESAVAFNDQQTAREVFESVAQDPDIEALALFGAAGDVLYGRGVVSPELSAPKEPAQNAQLVAQDSRVAAVVPVVSLEGPRGTLVLEVSTRRLLESRRAVLKRAAVAGLVAMALGALGAYAIARTIARRLGAMAVVADKVAAGDLDQGPVDEGGPRDEIGRLATAINFMLGQIRALVGQIRESAQKEQERLEGLVAVRTNELHTRNAEMRSVLDNVGQGFFSLDATGRMSRERSAIVEKWFGTPPEDAAFSTYLGQVAPKSGQWFALAWESVTDGILPLEVALDQLPKRFQVEARHFELDYRPIVSETGELERVLVVVSDITALLDRERAEAGERELSRLFSRLIADRAGFLEFFAEARELVDDIVSPATVHADLKRALHTLKGNAGIYGLESLAALCHRMEDAFAERGSLTPGELSELSQRWLDISGKVRAFVSESDGRVEIHDEEYEKILRMVERGAPRAQIRQMILEWRLESTESRLSRIAEQATALADRLGKGPIEVRIESNEIKLNPEVWREFWGAAVHIVRNAVDHGLEAAGERAELGKEEAARLDLRTSISGNRFTIEFADNGRGIDWSRVEQKALSLGLPCGSQSELFEALFVDGVSTRETVSETSGRGIGLSAARAACAKWGGHVEVESAAGEGTTFRFVWPTSVLKASSKPPKDMKQGSMPRRVQWSSLPPCAESQRFE